ncbi:MFS transporter [Marinicella rhabdoformis]|uniref:MFS transporter n=1 Tax=Marinicella rhabdoformis TaxID=2580566 RepID=UPI0012AEDC10|nr:MFS transporter [Marinicella rhabdoformis]
MSKQFALLKERRFFPFFLTQFLGAFNDNVFKNALVIMIAFKVAEQQVDGLTNLAFGLFILPFFLFSAFAGQVADKYEKSALIQRVKMFEIMVMLTACAGFYFQSVGLLIFVLFLMGSQSSLFGPVKYGYLPEKLSTDELIGGNAMVEASTFISILLGTILGGILIAKATTIPISFAVVLFAVLGFIASKQIPNTPPADDKIQLDWNILRATKNNLKFLPGNRVVFLSILGISWFWFFGSVFLAQMPNYTRTVLNGNEHVVTVLLTMFSIGIGAGSLLCEKLSGRRVEIGLVPVGAIGLAWFSLDLYWASMVWVDQGNLNFESFLSAQGAWRVCLDLMLIGVFGGLYIVPLYALIQERSDKGCVSRVIAGNNIINALFMVVAALLGIVVLVVFEMSIPQLFLITTLLHVIVCLYIFTVVPEFLMRLVAWFLVSMVYRVKTTGLDNIPTDGPVVLVCNHVTFVDPMILGGRIRRPVRFVMYYKIFQHGLMKPLFKAAKTIPIASPKESVEIMENAFASVKTALENNDVVGIFPEGALTKDGHMAPFKKGIERIITETPVTVVPMALNNLWGSYFSRYDKKIIHRRPRKLWAKVELIVGQPIPPEEVTAERLFEAVTELKTQADIANPLAPKTDSNA